MDNNCSQKGTLYIVATPIGNMEEITLRALETLKSCDEIYCEDTRVTVNLLNRYSINKPLNSYHEHNEKRKTDEIIDKLLKGFNIAVVSDAGTPCISDPGFKIVTECIDKGINYTLISGPCAAVSALVLSGMPVHSFFFAGFLPNKGTKRTTLLKQYLSIETTTILYESTYRIEKLINELYNIDKNIILVIVKEISKLNETVYSGSAEEFFTKKVEYNKKGEFVVLFNPLVKKEI